MRKEKEIHKAHYMFMKMVITFLGIKKKQILGGILMKRISIHTKGNGIINFRMAKVSKKPLREFFKGFSSKAKNIKKGPISS